MTKETLSTRPVPLTSWLAGHGAGGQTFTVGSQCSAVGPRPEVVHTPHWPSYPTPKATCGRPTDTTLMDTTA